MKIPHLVVPLSRGEEVRLRLLELDLLLRGASPSREEADLLLPLNSPTVPEELGFEIVSRDVPVRESPLRWQDRVEIDDTLRSQLPRAYDQLGSLILIRLPDSMADHGTAIGEALLETHLWASGVFHDRGVTGPFRIRDLWHLAGERQTRTVHRENGVAFFVDPARAYFSPRLGAERQRVIDLVKEGERVIDLCTGVGPLAIPAAAKGAAVIAGDLNPDAVELARFTARSLGLDLITAVWDARTPAIRPRSVDRVFLNLPHDAFTLVGTAAELLRPGGVLHMWEILAETEIEHRRRDLEQIGKILESRAVHGYATGVHYWSFDLEILAD